MKRLFLVLFILMLPAGAVRAQNPARNPEFLRAQTLESEGNLPEAIAIYEKLNASSVNTIYFWKLISLYEQIGDWDALEILARRSLQQQPDFIDARRYLAQALFKRGDSEEAKKVLLEALEGNWGNAEVVEFIAGEFTSQQHYADALEIYLRARETLGDETAYAVEMARVYQFQEKYVRAIEEYVRILDVDKVVNVHCSMLIDNATEQGVSPDSVAAPFLSHLEGHPESIAAARLAAVVFSESGRYEDAFAVIRGPAIATGSYGDIWELARQIGAEGHRGLAVVVYDEFARSFPENPYRVRAMLSAARLAAESGDREDAKKRYQTVISEYAGTFEAASATIRLIELSANEISFETYTGMLSEFAGTTEFQQASYEAYRMLGDLYLDACMTGEAEDAFTKAKLSARSAREQYEINVRIAYYSFYAGEFEQMRSDIQEAIAVSASGSDINDLLALRILSMRCTTEYDRARLSDFAGGRYALYRGDIEGAIAVFTPLVSDEASVLAPQAAMELGSLCQSLERNDEALDWYLKAASTARDSTVHVGAVMAAASLMELTPEGRVRAKEMYIDALTRYPGTVYDAELRKRLEVVIMP